jgi:hypothetical protein
LKNDDRPPSFFDWPLHVFLPKFIAIIKLKFEYMRPRTAYPTTDQRTKNLNTRSREIGCIGLLAATVFLTSCGGHGDSSNGGSTTSDAPSEAPSTVAVEALTIDAVSPSEGPPGTDVAIAGSGFTKATRVYWGDVELATTFQSPQRMIATLPPNDADSDQTNFIRVKREDDVEQRSTSHVTVESIPAVLSMSPTEAREGHEIQVKGKRLKHVKAVLLGDKHVPVQSTDGDGQTIRFVVPKGAGSGTVYVVDAKERRTYAGTLTVVQPLGALQISNVEVSQGQLISVNQATIDPYLRLVPERDTLVRVRLKPPAAHETVHPVVKLTVSNDALGTQTFTMAGPQRLGAAPIAEDDLKNSYTYTVPGKWIGPGFHFKVESSERSLAYDPAQFSFTPPKGAVRGPTYIKLHIVPVEWLENGKLIKADLDLKWFTTHIKAVFPLSDIDFVVEPFYRNDSLAHNNSYLWIDAMREMRAKSNPKNYDFFFGVLPCGDCTGLGDRPGRAAVASHIWRGNKADSINGVMTHEIGHTFGRYHSFEEKEFPYKDNRLGGPWAAYVNSNNALMYADPTKWYDVMSYSYPKTVSDYTYAGAYDYLEKSCPLSDKPKATSASQGSKTRRALPAQANTLYIQGRIDLKTGKAVLSTPIAVQSTPDTVPVAVRYLPGDNEYMLEIVTEHGFSRYKLALSDLDDSPDLMKSFEMNVPPVAGMKALRIIQGRSVLTEKPLDAASRPGQ